MSQSKRSQKPAMTARAEDYSRRFLIEEDNLRELTATGLKHLLDGLSVQLGMGEQEWLEAAADWKSRMSATIEHVRRLYEIRSQSELTVSSRRKSARSKSEDCIDGDRQVSGHRLPSVNVLSRLKAFDKLSVPERDAELAESIDWYLMLTAGSTINTLFDFLKAARLEMANVKIEDVQRVLSGGKYQRDRDGLYYLPASRRSKPG